MNRRVSSLGNPLAANDQNSTTNLGQKRKSFIRVWTKNNTKSPSNAMTKLENKSGFTEYKKLSGIDDNENRESSNNENKSHSRIIEGDKDEGGNNHNPNDAVDTSLESEVDMKEYYSKINVPISDLMSARRKSASVPNFSTSRHKVHANPTIIQETTSSENSKENIASNPEFKTENPKTDSKKSSTSKGDDESSNLNSNPSVNRSNQSIVREFMSKLISGRSEDTEASKHSAEQISKTFKDSRSLLGSENNVKGSQPLKISPTTSVNRLKSPLANESIPEITSSSTVSNVNAASSLAKVNEIKKSYSEEISKIDASKDTMIKSESLEIKKDSIERLVKVGSKELSKINDPKGSNTSIRKNDSIELLRKATASKENYKEQDPIAQLVAYKFPMATSTEEIEKKESYSSQPNSSKLSSHPSSKNVLNLSKSSVDFENGSGNIAGGSSQDTSTRDDSNEQQDSQQATIQNINKVLTLHEVIKNVPNSKYLPRSYVIYSAVRDYIGTEWWSHMRSKKSTATTFAIQDGLFYLLYSFIMFLSFLVSQSDDKTTRGADAGTLMLFILCMYFVFQVNRAIYVHSNNFLMPMYMSLLAYPFFYLYSRYLQRGGLVSWFFVQSIIRVQTAHPHILAHLSIYLMLLLLVHFLCSHLKQDSIFNCSILKNSTATIPDDQYVKLTLMCPSFSIIDDYISLFIRIISFGCILAPMYTLVYSMRRSALFILTNINQIKNLANANESLRKQLKVIEKEQLEEIKSEKIVLAKIDLNSPISRTVRTLMEVKNNCFKQRRKHKDYIDIVITLNAIIKVVTSNQFYDVTLHEDKVDKQIHDWLKELLTTSKNEQVPDSSRSLGLTEIRTSHSTILSNNEDFRTETEAIQKMYPKLHLIDFDTMEVTKITSGHPLLFCGLLIFQQYTVCTDLGIDTVKLEALIKKVESNYRTDVPYHNSAHAADVLQYIHFLLQDDKFKFTITPEETLAALIAAMWHDMYHPGVNNNFLIQTNHPIAVRYNDLGVLENYHSSQGFQMMIENKDINILDHMPKDRYKKIREQVVSMIMATDMGNHFELINRFKNKADSDAGIDLKSPVDRKMLFQVTIKAADISNSSRPWNISKKWTFQIMEEFFRQGQAEKDHGLPVSVFMNRENTDILKCQVSFIDFVVRPLYEPLSKIITSLKEDAINNLEQNRQHWTNPAMDHDTANLNNNKLPLNITRETFEGVSIALNTIKSKSFVRGTRGASFVRSPIMENGSFTNRGRDSFNVQDKTGSKMSVATEKSEDFGGAAISRDGSFIAEDDVRYIATPGKRRSSLLASEELSGLFNKLATKEAADEITELSEPVLLVKPAARRPSLFVGDILPQNPENTLKEEEEPENPWENDLDI